jgi:hypothetical protein
MGFVRATCSNPYFGFRLEGALVGGRGGFPFARRCARLQQSGQIAEIVPGLVSVPAVDLWQEVQIMAANLAWCWGFVKVRFEWGGVKTAGRGGVGGWPWKAPHVAYSPQRAYSPDRADWMARRLLCIFCDCALWGEGGEHCGPGPPPPSRGGYFRKARGEGGTRPQKLNS